MYIIFGYADETAPTIILPGNLAFTPLNNVWLASKEIPSFDVPAICKRAVGVVVPIPTLPLLLT